MLLNNVHHAWAAKHRKRKVERGKREVLPEIYSITTDTE